jgi:hypothetical protein
LEDKGAHQALHQQLDHRLSAIFEELKAGGQLKSSVPNDWLLHLYDALMMCAWETLDHGCVAPRDIPDLSWQSFAFGVLQSQP